MLYQSKIAGLGSYVPDNIVTNDYLSKLMDTSDEWIQERTGIEERRQIKAEGETPDAEVGVKAAKIALERAEIDKDDIDLIIFATLSPDCYLPGSVVSVHERMNI